MMLLVNTVHTSSLVICAKHAFASILQHLSDIATCSASKCLPTVFGVLKLNDCQNFTALLDASKLVRVLQ